MDGDSFQNFAASYFSITIHHTLGRFLLQIVDETVESGKFSSCAISYARSAHPLDCYFLGCRSVPNAHGNGRMGLVCL